MSYDSIKTSKNPRTRRGLYEKQKKINMGKVYLKESLDAYNNPDFQKAESDDDYYKHFDSDINFYGDNVLERMSDYELSNHILDLNYSWIFVDLIMCIIGKNFLESHIYSDDTSWKVPEIESHMQHKQFLIDELFEQYNRNYIISLLRSNAINFDYHIQNRKSLIHKLFQQVDRKIIINLLKIYKLLEKEQIESEKKFFYGF